MTDPNSDEPTPKIIVDDDWKSQVQAEKEELKKKEAETESEDASKDAEAGAQDSASANENASEEAPQDFPPASFLMLVTTLGAQAMSALGFMPDPTTGKTHTNRPMAKHFIDTLGVLDEKTKGNLTEEEANYMAETLHQLRMAFVTPPETAE